MTRLYCPQCGSLDVIFYEGMLGYEAIRCNTCYQETDANRPESHCERPDRLTDLCHHAEYRIYLNGQYVESVGSLGTNAQRARDAWQRRNRRKFVEVRPTPCTVTGCQRRAL